MSKQCLAIPRATLERYDFWDDLLQKSALALPTETLQHLIADIDCAKMFYDRYGEHGIEQDSSLQQIICYGVLRQGNKFLVYQRPHDTAVYHEGRLASKLSAGVGGHIEPSDASIMESLYREIDEEMRFIRGKKVITLVNDKGKLADWAQFRILGLLKEEDEEVGKMHMGIAVEVQIDPDIQATIREGENLESWMLTRAAYDQMVSSGAAYPETWTTYMLDKLLFA